MALGEYIAIACTPQNSLAFERKTVVCKRNDIELANLLLESFRAPPRSHRQIPAVPQRTPKAKKPPYLPWVCSEYWPPIQAQFVFLSIWYLRPFGNADLYTPHSTLKVTPPPLKFIISEQIYSLTSLWTRYMTSYDNL